MKIVSMKMRNFGPYFGEQTVELAGQRPLTMIFGSNMRGKTSLLNAIRWGLYGHALDRFGYTMPITKLINWDASDASDWTMSVHLELEVEADNYHLMRHVQAKNVKPPPAADKDFDFNFQVEVNGNFLAADEAVKSINRVLPEEISRFFLFDGEQLNDYENLLADEASQGRLVRESIERILGLPALTNGLADLVGLLKEAGKRQQKLGEDDDKAKLYATASARAQAEIDQAELDIGALLQQMEIHAERRLNLDQELQTTAGIEQDASRLQELQKRIEILAVDEGRLVTQRAEKLADAWRDLLQPMLQGRIDGLETDLSERFAKASRAGVIREKISELEKLNTEQKCPTCGQPMAAVKNQASVEKQILVLQDDLKALEPIEAGIQNLGAAIGRLRKVRAAGVGPVIRSADDDIRRVRVETTDAQLKYDEINHRLKGHDHSSVVKNRHDYELLTKEIGAIEAKVAEKREDIGEKQSQIAKFRTQITRESGPAMDALNHEVLLYENLVDIFQKAHDALRDRLRSQVARDASEIFRRLTTDKSYSGLTINESYGLTIVDSGNRAVKERSAGAEQVVALALIGALNRNAVRKGPLIMDTPFGRLDPGHRKNILEALPQLTDQVALFVHEGEVDRSRDLDAVRSSIDREYEIRFVTSRRSEIVALEQ